MENITSVSPGCRRSDKRYNRVGIVDDRHGGREPFKGKSLLEQLMSGKVRV